MVKVSIVVPVYNVDKYLETCLESLVNQTLKSIEIIVVNDGSTDFSQCIIDKYVKLYPNLIKSYSKNNGGLSDARNFGISKCKGEYIGFVDSDDYVALDMYELLYNEAKSKDCDIVSCDYLVVFNNKNRIVKAEIAPEVNNRFINMKAAAWNKIYRRSFIQNINVVFPVGLIYEDTSFFCKIIPFANNVGYVNKPLVYYVQRSNSISNTQGKKNEQIFSIMDDIIHFYKINNIYEKYYYELEYMVSRVLLGSSLSRISKIENKSIKSELENKTIEFLSEKFPQWKKNNYIKQDNLLRRILMKIICKQNIGFISKIYKYHK